MKIGVISDIHGNARAFEPCIDFILKQKVDRIIFLGDAVGYMPFGAEVLDLLKKVGVECIKGNHEAMLMGMLPIKEGNKEIYKLTEQKNKIGTERFEYIRSWKEYIIIEAGGRKYYFVHGSPDDHLKGYVYPDTDLSGFKELEWDVVIMGHTHYPFLREEYGKVFINPGSVGLPRDVGNLSSFVIIETDSLTVKHFRMEFDVEEILSEMNKEDIHEITAERLKKNHGKEFFGELVNN